MMKSDNLTKLAIKAKSGDKKAKEELALYMYPKAEKLAKSYAYRIPGGQEYIDDYKNEAMIGMLESLSTFNAEKGSFHSYAEYAMRQKIRDFLNFRQRMIAQPKNLTEKISKLSRAINDLEARQEEISDESLSKATGFSPKILKRVKSAMDRQYIFSLDRTLDDGENVSLCQILPDEIDIEEDIVKKDASSAIEMTLSILDSYERFLLLSSFGAFGYERKTLWQIASYFGVSITTISNRKKSIEDKIRQNAMVS